jgi:hypothetical protein
MGRACSTHGGYEKCIQNFDWKNLKERDHSENPGIGGNILGWILGK